MSDLQTLINECIKAKKGDKEFALFYLDGLEPDEAWRAEIGNENSPVMLGESEGEIRERGKTPEEAVSKLLEAIKSANPTTTGRE